MQLNYLDAWWFLDVRQELKSVKDPPSWNFREVKFSSDEISAWQYGSRKFYAAKIQREESANKLLCTVAFSSAKIPSVKVNRTFFTLFIKRVT